jgi:hypothetical protein
LDSDVRSTIMKLFLLIAPLFLFYSCASKPLPPVCADATVTVTIPKSEANKIHGHVSHFLTDAKITQIKNEDGTESSIWRFTNMPDDSIYYLIGLREGDAIYKTNLGAQTSSINLISDLSGIPSGTTNCLYVRSKDNSEHVIKIVVEKL